MAQSAKKEESEDPKADADAEEARRAVRSARMNPGAALLAGSLRPRTLNLGSSTLGAQING